MKEWAAFIRVTGIAELVPVLFEVVFGNCPMWIVTTAAVHFTLPHGMVTGAKHFSLDVPMTLVTGGNRWFNRIPSLMHLMARSAR